MWPLTSWLLLLAIPLTVPAIKLNSETGEVINDDGSPRTCFSEEIESVAPITAYVPMEDDKFLPVLASHYKKFAPREGITSAPSTFQCECLAKGFWLPRGSELSIFT